MEKYTYFRDEQGHLKTRVRTVRVPRKGQKPTVRNPLEEGGTYKFINGHLELIEAGPKPPALHIRPDTAYRSRDGRKIQVWVINKDSIDKPVLGMILTEGTWEARYWNEKGIAKVPYGPGNDIVVEYSEG